MPHFIDVVLPIRLARQFTYSITEEEYYFLAVGMRVSIPFGKRKIYTGIVLNIHEDEPTVYDAKPIDQILDEVPLVNTIQIRHWQWVADYYMCTLGEVVRSALPSAFLLESETMVSLNREATIDQNTLSDEAFLVVEALEQHSFLSIKDVMAITGKKNVMPLLDRLMGMGLVVTKEKLFQQYRPKKVRHVKLANIFLEEGKLQELLEELSRAPKQKQALLWLFQLSAKESEWIRSSDLVKQSGCTPNIIKALVDKGIFEEQMVQLDRGESCLPANEVSELTLSQHQKEAFAKIKELFQSGKPALLFGVTSSGKTEVYIKLIKEAIAEGKQVVYLLPEIALTSQLIVRIRNFFREQVSVYHSKYSVNERIEVWNNVKREKSKAQIVIGARSALFLPFSNLGLVIIDEEHEESFKQFDPAPRYHARDGALVLAKMHGANCILGSATPSLESFKNVRDNKYGMATMTERFGKVLLPNIELVDIKEARRKKRMKGHFSEKLFLRMEEHLKNGRQIILFQNRRGFSPIVECTTCGHSERCPNCDVGLTYHQYKNQLRCHYCGYHEVLQPTCKACGNNTLDKLGFGTEQIQEEAEKLFPEAKVARMDLDTTRGKYAYQKIIGAFENHEVDILVGTQMVAKGLDFRNVGLVGVMNADTLLNMPDYRAHERGFQLLSQVSGRAGRTLERGEVLIQTYNPYHKILQQVTTNAYIEMFEEQLYERERFKYPPVVRMIKITLKCKDFSKLDQASDWLATSLRNIFGQQVLGPEIPVVSRVKREYLKNILIKINDGQSLQKTKKSIKKIENSFDAIGVFKSVRLLYNVDHI